MPNMVRKERRRLDQMEEKTCLRMSPKDCTEGYTQERGFGFRVFEVGMPLYWRQLL
jgi:hypothetical protein